MNKKDSKQALIALGFGLILLIVLNVEPVKEIVYADNWVRKVIGLLILVVVLFSLYRGAAKSKAFHQEFQRYVQEQHLTPEKLARLTEFNKADFYYEGTELVFRVGSPENREKLLKQLREHFGE